MTSTTSTTDPTAFMALLATTSMVTTTLVLTLATTLLLWKRHSKSKTKCPPFPPVEPVEDVLKRGLKKKSLPTQADAIVIGSGPSGLSAAAFLTGRGYKVLVLEQHDRAGGGLHCFVEKGQYEFDTGFHYIGECGAGEPFRRIADWLTGGEIEWSPIHDCKVEPGMYDQVHFLNEDYTNGHKEKPFSVPAGKENWAQALKEAFPDESKAIDTYMEEVEACSKTHLVYCIWRAFFPLGSLLSRLLKPLLAKPQLHYATKLASEQLDRLFQNERLKAILGYVTMGCIGVPPDQLNYAMLLAMHHHFSEGAFYPKHGPSSIAAAMIKKIERGGGRVLVRAGVDRILVDKNNKTTGVQLTKEGLMVKSPIVISSIGLRETVQGLLRTPEEAGPEQINSGFSGKVATSKTIDPMSPAQRETWCGLLDELPHGQGHIYGFVGIKSDTALNLPKRNVWFLPEHNLRGGLDAFQNDPTKSKPFAYVGLAFPSGKDPAYKEKYGEGVTTAALVAGDLPWDWFQQWKDTRIHKRGAEYEQFKESFQERLLELLYLKYPQVKGKVDFVELGTPVDTRTYLGRLTGASYGIPPTLAKVKADSTWLAPKMPELLPEGVILAGQDISCDGFVPSVVTGLMAMGAIEGIFSLLDVVTMLGGWIEFIKIL